MLRLAYFDQNVWSHLADNAIKGKYDILQQLTNRLMTSQIAVPYSLVNVTETLMRPVDKHRAQELGVIKAISRDLYLTEKGRISHFPITELLEFLIKHRTLVESSVAALSPIFEDFKITNRSTRVDNRWDSKIINNFPVENLFQELQSIAIGTGDFVWTNYRKKQMIKHIRTIFKRLKHAIPEIVLTITGAERIHLHKGFVKIDRILKGKEEQIINNLRGMGDLSLENPADGLRKLGAHRLQLPGMLISLLADTQYWPDRRAVMRKKARSIDFADVEHVNHGQFVHFFVTNDKALRHRAKAAYAKLEIQTKVLPLSEFLADPQDIN